MIQLIDVDNDGFIDLKEFIKAMAEKNEVQNKTIQYSIERLESEDNMVQGTIGRIELDIVDVDFDIEVWFGLLKIKCTTKTVFRKRTLKPSTKHSESLTKMLVGK